MTKISEFIRNGVANFVTNTALGGMLNLNKNSGNNSGMPKQLQINASPFEIPPTPIERITADPLGFENIQYPADLGSAELGHYILFFTLTNRMVSDKEASMDLAYSKSLGLVTGDTGEGDIKYNAQENKPIGSPALSSKFGTTGIGTYTSTRSTNLRTQYTQGKGTNKVKYAVQQVALDNTVLTEVPDGQIVTSAIALYMPPDVKVSYKAGWEPEDAELAGDIAEVIKGVRKASTVGEMFGEAIKGGIGAATGFIKKQGGELLAGFGGGDAFKLTSKAFGMAINPRAEMYYEGPQFRQFQYSFKFWPRTQDESHRVQNIIKLFKYHMHPITDEDYYGRMFRIPSEFEIHYLCKDGVNEKLNKISRCALSDCEVSYNPDGNPKFFEDNSPVSYQINLTFKELEYMTKDKMEKGY